MVEYLSARILRGDSLVSPHTRVELLQHHRDVFSRLSESGSHLVTSHWSAVSFR